MEKTALSLELVLKFLDCAKRTTEEKAKSEVGLDAKLTLYRHARQIQEARTLIRTNYYAFCDWCKTEIYEAPEE